MNDHSGPDSLRRMASPRRRATIAEEITEEIRTRIITGKLPAGQPINQGVLAEELDVSTTPVREALLRLEAEGFIQTRPRRSFEVVRFAREDVADVFYMYAFIASELCVRSAQAAGSQLVTILQGHQDAYREAVERGEVQEMSDTNWRFHHAMSAGTDSNRLRWMVRNLMRITPSYFVFENAADYLPKSVRAHDLIIEAVGLGTEAAIRDAVSAHIGDARDAFIEHLSSEGYWG